MTKSNPDRWTAFLLSLLLPGVGQCYARHASAVLWLGGAGGCAALTSVASNSFGALIASGIITVILAVASAEHAKRCAEADELRLASRVDCDCLGGDTVQARVELAVPLPAEVVWPVVADLSRFLCVDPFHSRIVLDAADLRPGVGLALEHRAFGFRLWRVGRVLKWKEGRGYAFSDLSERGPRHGFPHVFFVSVLPISTIRSALCIEIRGRWTAGWVPHWLRRCWLRYVCLEHARLINALFSREVPCPTFPSRPPTSGTIANVADIA